MPMREDDTCAVFAVILRLLLVGQASLASCATTPPSCMPKNVCLPFFFCFFFFDCKQRAGGPAEKTGSCFLGQKPISQWRDPRCAIVWVRVDGSLWCCGAKWRTEMGGIHHPCSDALHVNKHRMSTHRLAHRRDVSSLPMQSGQRQSSRLGQWEGLGSEWDGCEAVQASKTSLRLPG